jgi:hypothetical protein
MPTYNAVAVRMFNQTGRNQYPSFNYLTDIRRFGNVVIDSLRSNFCTKKDRKLNLQRVRICTLTEQ